MIERIELINFQSTAECYCDWQYSRETFLPISYSFEKGNVYGFCSDFGCGSWGLATCLSGYGKDDYSGEFYLNNRKTSPKEISKYESSCFIPKKIFGSIDLEENTLTTKDCIEKALNTSGEPYSLEEIKSIFCLSDERFNRPIDYISGEIWLVSLAVNFSLGKEIFCYPWLNSQNIFRFKVAYDLNIIDFLVEKGKIVFLPSSQKKFLKKYCTHMIAFEERKKQISRGQFYIFKKR